MKVIAGIEFDEIPLSEAIQGGIQKHELCRHEWFCELDDGSVSACILGAALSFASVGKAIGARAVYLDLLSGVWPWLDNPLSSKFAAKLGLVPTPDYPFVLDAITYSFDYRRASTSAILQAIVDEGM